MKPKKIEIKNPDVLIGLMERRYSPLLVTIIAWVAKTYGLVMTESWREQRHMGDLHSRGRAIDLRSYCYPDRQAQEIMQEINQKWQYDPDRPEKKVAIIHKVSGGAEHFHIQVHPNTIRRSI